MTALIIVFLSATAAFAQPVSVAPLRYWAPEKDQLREAVKRQLPSARNVMAHPVEQVLHPLTREEMAKAPVRENLLLTGIHRPVPVDLAAFGRWDTLADGRKLWRAALHSPGAAGLRLHFENFAVGAGRVWLHDSDGHVDGPYTGRGLFGDGEFWSETLFGNSVTVEYEPATDAGEEVPFQVVTIAHTFPGFFDVEKKDTAKEAAAPCHLDVTCYPQWAETARAEARLVFEKDGGSYFCSGTLLNTRNSSRIPYFLTANHCIDTEAVARTVQAFWQYQTANCGGTAPGTRDLPRSNGSRLLATGDENQGDFSLLQLTDVPNGVYFSGWTSQEVPLNTNLTGIHHPAGDYKRISFGTRRSTPSAVGLLAADVAYTVTWGDGHTEGGSSGSGLFSSPGVLVGTLTGGLRPPAGGTKCDINPDSSFYGRLSAYYPRIREFLEDGTTAPVTPTTPTGAVTLASGTPQTYNLTAVANPTLFENPTYAITVPAGATRLTVRMETSTPNADTDLYVRFGTAPVISGGTVLADHRSIGSSGTEMLSVDSLSIPVLRAGTYYISIVLYTTGVAVRGTMTATVLGGPPTPNPTAGVNQLTSGASATFNLQAVTTGTFFSAASNMYSITVPQGATRLTVRLSTATAGADVDLYARFGTAPQLVGGRVSSDHSSTGDTGEETITVTASSSPALRAGTYFIALALFTSGTAVRGTVTATVESGGGSTAPPPSGSAPVVLTSNVPRTFSLPAVQNPTLLNATNVYTVEVPAGARQLVVRINTPGVNADTDLYVNYNSVARVANGTVQSDHRSETDGTGSETITITPSSTPALRAGTYYITMALFTTGTAVNGTVVATVDSGADAPGGGRSLLSGQGTAFQLGAVQSATLFGGEANYTITVPEGSTRLQVRITSADPRVDVDLYVRYGSPVEVLEGSVVSDYSGESETGNETISVTSASKPGLRPGVYYVALALYSTGVPASGTLTATVDRELPSAPAPAGNSLTPGQPVTVEMPAVTQATFYSGTQGFSVAVPEGSPGLTVRLRTVPAEVDLDLYVRQGSPPELQDGRIVADYRSIGDTGDETISVSGTSTPPLRAGTYFIALANFTTGRTARIQLVAELAPSDVPQEESAMLRKPKAAIGAQEISRIRRGVQAEVWE